MILGLTDVLVIWPKAADDPLVLGLLNCGVLKALKNSVRNSTFAPSRNQLIAVRLMTAMSELFWPGPTMMPTPLFPKLVPPPASINGHAASPFDPVNMQARLM